MELIQQLKQDGIDKGLCRLWQGKLRAGLSTEELAKLYIKGIDFCISEDYPTLDFLREHFKGKCEPFGVYVDDEIPPTANKPDMVLNGACKAMLEYDGFAVSRLYVRHDSEAAVIVSDNAIVTIDLFDNAKIHISVIGTEARVNINAYGRNTTVDYIGISTFAKIKTIFHDKTTY